MTSNSQYLVELQSIGYAVGGAKILQDINLTISVGNHTLLLGPSGSGKTSLLNLITGLATPATGHVRVAGEPMSELAASKRDDLRRRTIGVVFQSLRLVSALSVQGNLKLAQRLSGLAADQAAIDTLIDAVGVSRRADAKPRFLSQGEAQRAAIARALIGKPKLLVADEPTSALDDKNADEIARLLLQTADAHQSTLLIATHDARLKSLIPHSFSLNFANGAMS
jgi:putative ABC transport system ATP-binding protein